LLDSLDDETVLVLDEAYGEYAETQEDFVSGYTKLADHPNLIVLRTFSKAYGLAGLRVGYALGHPDRITWMCKARQPFNLNGLSEPAALLALADQAYLAQSVQENNREREWLTQELEGLGFRVLKSGANFLCVFLGSLAQPIYDVLLARGVIVRDLANYGFPDAIRITIGTKADNRRLVRELRSNVETVHETV
jgi:histidinol-phosphate aminotransferase